MCPGWKATLQQGEGRAGYFTNKTLLLIIVPLAPWQKLLSYLSPHPFPSLTKMIQLGMHLSMKLAAPIGILELGLKVVSSLAVEKIIKAVSWETVTACMKAISTPHGSLHAPVLKTWVGLL